MGEERSNFQQLERNNRRKTVELVAIFILVYATLGFSLDLIFHPFRLVDHRLSRFPGLMLVAAAIAAAQALRAYYRGSDLLLGALGARDLIPDSAKTQMVADVVDEIALAARIPRPRLSVMDDSAPNAFAAGRDPAHSLICVTQGLVDQLAREEMQGVIAHEIAHIRGHDTRITQMATVMVGGFALVSGSVWRTAAAQRRGDIAAIPGFGLVALPIFILSGIGWLFSKVAAIALSRQREFLADAAAVEFTRNPNALIRALEHIAGIESPLKTSLRAVAPLFIVDPYECGSTFSGGGYLDQVTRIESQQDKSKEQRDAEVLQYMAKAIPEGILHSAFSSHPPIRQRIARLRGLLHDGSAAPQDSEAEVKAQRRAAAENLKEISERSPEAMATVLGGLLGAGPAQLLTRALEGNVAGSQAETAAAPQEGSDADASEQTTYKKLFEYNLALTGDRLRLEEERARQCGSPLEAMLGDSLAKIDPEKLRIALTIGITSAHKSRATAPPNDAGSRNLPKMLGVIIGIVVALLVGAIIAGLAVR